MNIMFLAKYPPIIGGESSKLYWLAKSLGERGHKCYIVSNCQEKKSRCDLSLNDLEFLQPNKNIRLYSTSPLSITNINEKFTTERLSNLGLEIVANEPVDMIVGWYLMPYCSAAYNIGNITKKPYLIQHAGSDMFRILQDDSLKSFLLNVIQSASGILSYPSYFNFFKQFSDKVFLHRPQLDEDSFKKTPDFEFSDYDLTEIEGKKKILFLGKVTKPKGIYELLSAFEKINNNEEYALWIVGDDSKELVKNKQVVSVYFLNQVPPWRIPGIIRASRMCVIPENNFGVVGHTTRIPVESMICKTPIIISEEVKNKFLYQKLEENKNCLIVNPKDTNIFSEKLELILEDDSVHTLLSEKGYDFIAQSNNFEKYITEIETFLAKI